MDGHQAALAGFKPKRSGPSDACRMQIIGELGQSRLFKNDDWIPASSWIISEAEAHCTFGFEAQMLLKIYVIWRLYGAKTRLILPSFSPLRGGPSRENSGNFQRFKRKDP